MKIVRILTYVGSEPTLRHQMRNSLRDGQHFPHGRVSISIASNVIDGGLEGQASESWWPEKQDEVDESLVRTFEKALDVANKRLIEAEKHSQRQDDKIQALHAEIEKLQLRMYLEKIGPIHD